MPCSRCPAPVRPAIRRAPHDHGHRHPQRPRERADRGGAAHRDRRRSCSRRSSSRARCSASPTAACFRWSPARSATGIRSRAGHRCSGSWSPDSGPARRSPPRSSPGSCRPTAGRRRILLTSVPSLLLVVLWWIVVRDRPERHPWVKPAELAEIAGESRVRRRGTAHGAPRDPRARRPADPARHALVSRHELRVLPRDVLELPVPGAGAEAVRARERLARRPAVRRRGHRRRRGRAHRGRPAPPLRRSRRAAHPAARHAAARRGLPVPDRFARRIRTRRSPRFASASPASSSTRATTGASPCGSRRTTPWRQPRS